MVVDSISARARGHVVATDDFGKAYVIPTGDTFRDIMIKPPAPIYIPNPDDIKEWYSTNGASRNAKPASSKEYTSPHVSPTDSGIFVNAGNTCTFSAGLAYS